MYESKIGNKMESTHKITSIEKFNKIRLEFIFKNSKNKIFNFRKKNHLVQGEPFEYGFKITNIGDELFSGALLSKFKITLCSMNMVVSSNKKPNIKQLNPNESTEIYFDVVTMAISGPIWIEAEFEAKDKEVTIYTYQYDVNHKNDEKYDVPNKWAMNDFVQGRLELLQTNTNIQILILTIITVLEGIFGLENIIRKTFSILGCIFKGISDFFLYLS